MTSQVFEGRDILISRLQKLLGMLVHSVEIAAQNNLSSSHVVAETTMIGLLNRVYDWELVNANAIRQNYPGVDLIDEKRNIAIQVTATRTVEKVRHTLEEVGKSGARYDNLIVLILTNAKPTDGMHNCTVPTYTGPMKVQNIPDVFRDAMELDPLKLDDLVKFMEAEVGSIRERVQELPHLELPPSSVLPATCFVGRQEELAEIQSRFALGDRMVVLTGLGGMGKTELAVRFGLDYPGLVYFVRFDTNFTRTLAKMVHGIRPKLVEEELRLEESILIKKVQTLLERSSPDDLLIIDNADSDTGALADLLRDPGYKLIQTLPLKLLLTTRSDSPRAIPITPMSEEPLCRIFENHGAQLSLPEMKSLIQTVNGHTLTIDLMARTLNGKGWRKVTAEMMLTALRENTLARQKYRKIATDYNQSTEQAQIYEHLSTVFDISGMPEVSRQVMRCACLLPEDGMEGECFGMSLPEAEQDALDGLLERGWLEMKHGLLTIHPIIRLICLTELKPTDELCEAFLNTLIGQYEATDYRPAQYRQMAQLLTNASNYLEDATGRWALEAGERWRDVGEFALAHKASLCAMHQLEALPSPNAPSLAQAYNNVGCTYGDLGNHQTALEYKKKSLAIREKALPPDHPDLAQSYSNVGSTYGKLGNHRKELEYQQKALAIREKALPPNHPDLAASYNNAGTTYGDLGNYQMALEYLQKALVICEKALPPDHPNLASSYNNVGSIHGKLGNHRKELEYQQKALAIREKALPPDHLDFAQSCSNVAWTYHELGDFQSAVHFMSRAADIISRSSLPKAHPARVNYPKWAANFEKDAAFQRKLLSQPQDWPQLPLPFPKK